MDGFGDDFVPAEAPPMTNSNEEDPAAEFLAREQDQLAGLEDDIPLESAAGTENEVAAPPPAAMENEIFGSEAISSDANDIGDEFNQPLNNYEDSQTARKYDYTPSPVTVREEPEKIRIWREKQEKILEEKDAAEEISKAELRERAKKELEEWYKQHEEQVAKTRQANREASKSAEKELVADTNKIEPGTEWERISKLCDFNPKTSKSSRDISRMRSIILQVKQNPPVKV